MNASAASSSMTLSSIGTRSASRPSTIRHSPPVDPVADAVHVIDLDGDGTDELLASYFLAPLNDASSLTEARVFRWAGDHFALLTTGKLPVGSGSSPYVLGDTDGLPGDEAAFISSSALDVLFRIRLDHDTLITEDSGLIVDDALAVPLSHEPRTRRARPDGSASPSSRGHLAVNPASRLPRNRSTARDSSASSISAAPHGCSCTAPIRTSSRFAPCPT